MQKCKRILSLLLTLAILFTAFTVNLQVSAVTYPMYGTITSNNGVANIYSIAGYDGDELNPEDKYKSEKLCELTNGTQVKVLGVETDGGGDKWYKINYGDNYENTGYAIVTRVTLKYEYVYDEDFEKNLANFPESYHDGLRSLHAKYPSWRFIADNIDLDFSTAVDLQYSPSDITKRRKLVQLTYGGEEWRDIRSFNESTQSWELKYEEGKWTYASRAAIAYFVDSRNYFDEKHIFAFLEQSYNENQQNKEGLRTVVANTFLAQGYDNDPDAYLDDIMLAAQESKVSPYVLAAAIIIEVGVNGGSVTSGTYPGYEGYYNFYNWKATGDDVIVNALKYAQENGWNSREAAIVGGAKMYADGYVSVGQDTYYYKNFNYVNSQSVSHQYAESVYGSFVDAVRLSKAFVDNVSGTATFKIPVFKNMPEKASPIPSAVEAVPEIVVSKGDVNFDGAINAIDLAAIKMHILGVQAVSENGAKAADINNDGAINAIDLAAVKMHILGVQSIS